MLPMKEVIFIGSGEQIRFGNWSTHYYSTDAMLLIRAGGFNWCCGSDLLALWKDLAYALSAPRYHRPSHASASFTGPMHFCLAAFFFHLKVMGTIFRWFEIASKVPWKKIHFRVAKWQKNAYINPITPNNHAPMYQGYWMRWLTLVQM